MHLLNATNYICHCVTCLVVLGIFLVLRSDVMASPLTLFMLLVHVSNLLFLVRYSLTGMPTSHTRESDLFYLNK